VLPAFANRAQATLLCPNAAAESHDVTVYCPALASEQNAISVAAWRATANRRVIVRRFAVASLM
jgi:hypothetical protein